MTCPFRRRWYRTSCLSRLSPKKNQSPWSHRAWRTTQLCTPFDTQHRYREAVITGIFCRTTRSILVPVFYNTVFTQHSTVIVFSFYLVSFFVFSQQPVQTEKSMVSEFKLWSNYGQPCSMSTKLKLMMFLGSHTHLVKWS